MIGQKFGRLTVLEQAKNDKPGCWWLCHCSCGNLIIRPTNHLRSGRNKSCGCLKHELQERRGYQATHDWLRKNKPKPKLCERCKEKPATDLSYNGISSKGYSQNPDDYEWLCRSCHMLKDIGNGAIITEALIHRIRELYTTNANTQRELADLFNISQSTVNNITKHKRV